MKMITGEVSGVLNIEKAKKSISGRLCILLLATSCNALAMVRIQKSQGQPQTSSTLQWVDLRTGQTPPANVVHVIPGGPMWCRAQQHGTWCSGAVVGGKCLFPFLAKVIEKDSYDVLVSINGSARILPVEWDRLQAIPNNAVSTPDMLMGVSMSEEGEALAGYVNPKERRAYILKDGDSKRQDELTILTEDEPTHYKVDHVVRDEEKSQKTTKEEVLATTTLTNNEKSVASVMEMVDYAAKEVLYWGRVRGTITALKATVVDPSGNERDITWGIENVFQKYEQQMIEFELPGEASVNATLVAVMHKYEASYAAKLTSTYSDGEKRQHPITGLHMHERLAELRADFSHPFFTENGTLIPGEFIPSHILIHSTTTTTTTTTTPAPHSSSPDGEKPQSGSLATSDGESGTSPKAEQMNGSSALAGSLALILTLCLLAFSRGGQRFH